jgi:hypothetical protein
MNLLQLVQQASNELGLTSPNNVIGNTSADIVQILSLTNALGSELQRQFPWNGLDKEYRFNTVAVSVTATTVLNSTTLTLGSAQTLDATYMVTGTGINQDTYCTSSTTGTTVILNQAATASGTSTITFTKTKYAMPSDYDRMVDKPQWDKTRHWEMLGPLTAQQWQFLKSGFISTGPRVRYRLLGGFFQIWPTVPNGEYLGFEYLSSNFVTDYTGVSKGSFTLDTDTCAFPDRLMVLGIKKKYFEIKGFDAGAITRDYKEELDNAKAFDQGSQTLSFAPGITSILVGYNNIPDSGYGS